MSIYTLVLKCEFEKLVAVCLSHENYRVLMTRDVHGRNENIK